jgi:hypothetical protein
MKGISISTVVLFTLIATSAGVLAYILIGSPNATVKTPTTESKPSQPLATNVTITSHNVTTSGGVIDKDTGGVGKISGTLEGPVVINITQLPP